MKDINTSKLLEDMRKEDNLKDGPKETEKAMDKCTRAKGTKATFISLK